MMLIEDRLMYFFSHVYCGGTTPAYLRAFL